MSLPKYKYLLTYRYAEIIHDLTIQFCRLYIDYRSRTKDQMEQAARSGKQNIVEGTGQSLISKKGQIKLIGVACASIEELIADYEDFLRQRKLEIWPKSDLKIIRLKKIAYRLSDIRNLSSLGNLIEKPNLPENPEESANFLLTLCHINTFLLNKLITSLENKFIKEGGFTENLFRKRMQGRITTKPL